VLHDDRRLRVLASDLAGAALERAIAHQRPRVVIFDDGVDHALLVGLGSRQPATGVIVIAHNPSHVLGTSLLAVGVSCLARAASAADLLTAVHLAARGAPTFFRLDGSCAVRDGPSIADVLTPREIEVFMLLSAETPYVVIALKMGVSIETVRTHAASIRRKLGVHSKQELAGMRLSSRLEGKELLTMNLSRG
jgi:DNA-binding NarL/FixJ family response regulator